MTTKTAKRPFIVQTKKKKSKFERDADEIYELAISLGQRQCLDGLPYDHAMELLGEPGYSPERDASNLIYYLWAENPYRDEPGCYHLARIVSRNESIARGAAWFCFGMDGDRLYLREFIEARLNYDPPAIKGDGEARHKGQIYRA